MTLNTTSVAGASEGTLNTLISAVGLVVTDLTAVVAFASEATSCGGVGALTSKMAGLVAAVRKSMH